MGGVCPRKASEALPDYNLMRTAHLPLSVAEDGGWQKNTALILHPVSQDGICVPPAPNSYISPNHRPLPPPVWLHLEVC